MIELNALLIGFILMFALIGYFRGLPRELISGAGVIVALFALYQFDGTIRGTLLVQVNQQTQFLVQMIIFLGIVFFAYQDRSMGRRLNLERNDGRNDLQSAMLGAIVGGVNGWLVFGSIWYFMWDNGYPLSPFISAPLEGSASAATITALPLWVLAGGPQGDAGLLSLLMILLVVVILVLI